MTKIFAAVAIAAMLAGCTSTPTKNTMHVATGVDANGQIIWQAMPRHDRPNLEPMQSLSTWNPFTGRFRN